MTTVIKRGRGRPKGYVCSPATREKIAESKRGDNNPAKQPEARRKQSERMRALYAAAASKE